MSTTEITRQLHELQAQEINEACALIAEAMNAEEAVWARKTLTFHFQSQSHGLHDGRHYYTYRPQQQLVALTGLHHYQWGPPENVWLAWFAVHPAFQRQGIGRDLVSAVEDLATRLGYRKLFIETYDHPDFTAARNFYAACGFQQVGTIEDYLPDSASMVVYLKPLA